MNGITQPITPMSKVRRSTAYRHNYAKPLAATLKAGSVKQQPLILPFLLP
jgi:hypothetical protein